MPGLSTIRAEAPRLTQPRLEGEQADDQLKSTVLPAENGYTLAEKPKTRELPRGKERLIIKPDRYDGKGP